MDNTTVTTLATLINSTLFDNNDTTTTNLTTTTSPPRVPRTPPPPGYYGDIRVQLWKILPPIIMTWGIAGNILSIIILLRLARKTSFSSTTLYLTTLAISDTAILLCGPLRNWLKVRWEKDVRYYSDASCKSQLYFTYFTIHFSSWILVAITMERVISVVLPHKVRIGCTPRNAGFVILAILLVIGGLSLVHPIIQGLESSRGNLKCSPTTEAYVKFRDDIYLWMDFFLSFGLPFLFLIIGNVIIIYKLNASRVRRKQMNASGGGGDGKSSGRDLRSLSILLISLCAIFLLTMTPVNVFQVYYPYRFEALLQIKDPYEQWSQYQYLLYQHAIVNVVGYTNAAFNFILYVLTGTKFRKEFIEMFKCLGLRRKLSRFDLKSSTSGTKSSSVSATEMSTKNNNSVAASSTDTITTKVDTTELTDKGNAAKVSSEKTDSAKVIETCEGDNATEAIHM